MDPSTLTKKIINEGRSMVLATSSLSGIPQVATVHYAQQVEDLVFYTFNDSRKYANLKTNPQVSVVIHNDAGYVQLEGVIKEVSGKDADAIRNLLIKKKGEVTGYYTDQRSRYFRLTPSWIRVRTKKEYPPEFVVVKGEK